MTIDNSTKTVVVLGGAYGGLGATATLAKHLPADWKVIAIERNTHANREELHLSSADCRRVRVSAICCRAQTHAQSFHPSHPRLEEWTRATYTARDFPAA